MKEDTKACNLTEYEIQSLIIGHGGTIHEDIEGSIERINYLNGRLKAFKKSDAPAATGAAAPASNDGWASN